MEKRAIPRIYFDPTRRLRVSAVNSLCPNLMWLDLDVRGQRLVKDILSFHQPLASSEDKTAITGAARDVCAVKIFEERNGVLTRDAREVFERGDINGAFGFML